MATEIDTYIKGPSPSKNPDSQYTYLEQQLTAVEKAFKKQKAAIVETSDNAQALYENEVTVRATADSALVQSIETLDAKVDLNNTTTQATIQSIQTTLADSESATATKLSTLESKVDSGDAANLALIQDEAKTRATKVDALASKVSSLEASVKTNAADARALVKQEAATRATADSAEATSRTELRAYVDTGLGSQYTVASKGLSATVAGTAGLFLGSSTSSINAAARSYNLWVISKADGTVSYNASYDVYAGTTAASNLASYLNGLDNSVVVVLATFNDPKPNRLTGGLPAAIRRCGGTRAIFGDEDYGQPLRNLFQALLNRVADTGGYNYYYGLLAAGSTTLTNVASEFLASAEYTTQHPSAQTNTAFVTMLYSNLYGRSPTSSEQTYWVGVLNGGTSKAQASADFVLAAVETWKSRSAYILVGTPGEGEGSGVEKYVGSVDNDTNAFCSFSFNVRNGRVDGVSGVGAVSAAITNEQTARVSSDNALSSSISTLSSTVTNNYNTLNSAITNEQTARANGDSANATSITNLTSTVTNNYNTLNSAITNEQTARANGDSANATSITNLTSTVTNNYNTLNSAITNEQTARANGDTTNANSITSLTSTVNGHTSSISTLSSTTSSITGALSAQWAVQGTIDGATGGLRLTGLKKSDGTGATYNLIIDANTTINGDLLVNGTVTNGKINDSAVTTAKINDNAVSNNWYQQGTSGYTSKSISVTAGNRYVIFAAYTGGQPSSVAGSATLDICYSYGTETVIQTMPVVFSGSGLILNVNFGYSSSTGSFVNGIGGTLNYTLPSAVAIASWTATSTGTVAIIGKIYTSGNLGQPLHLYIVELKK